MATDLVSDGEPSSTVIYVESQALVRGSLALFAADRQWLPTEHLNGAANVGSEVPAEDRIHSSEGCV